MGLLAGAKRQLQIRNFLKCLYYLLIRNLSRAHLGDSINSSLCFLVFLFSLPDGYFLHEMVVLCAEYYRKKYN
jgi:hypothetical protein